MRARFVNEKFTQDSDPVEDMGIGIEAKIKTWVDSLNLCSKPDSVDTLLRLCISRDKDDFARYIIRTKHLNNPDSLLITTIEYNKKELADSLIQLGAELRDLNSKAKYIVSMGGDLVSFTPKEEVTVTCKLGDYKNFLKLIKRGEKINIGSISSLFKKDRYYFTTTIPYEPQKILQYMRDHVNEIEDWLHPKDFSKIDKLKKILKIKDSPSQGRKYPMGYKTYRILKFINESDVYTIKEVIKFIYELTYGPDTFNPVVNGNYWKDGFSILVHPRLTRGYSAGYDRSKIMLNKKGKYDLKKMEKKFGNMTIIPAPYI